MKSIIISIRPKWVEKIVNGQKTIEVCKTAPKEVPFKVYIYCTYGNPKENYALGKRGKVIGEFICNKVDKYTFSYYEAEYRVTHVEQKAMCLNQPELIRYGVGKTLKGLYIFDLKIYDKPKELSEFYILCKMNCEDCKKPLFYDCWREKGRVKVVTRPPQSWCYVESEQ